MGTTLHLRPARHAVACDGAASAYAPGPPRSSRARLQLRAAL